MCSPVSNVPLNKSTSNQCRVFDNRYPFCRFSCRIRRNHRSASVSLRELLSLTFDKVRRGRGEESKGIKVKVVKLRKAPRTTFEQARILSSKKRREASKRVAIDRQRAREESKRTKDSKVRGLKLTRSFSRVLVCTYRLSAHRIIDSLQVEEARLTNSSQFTSSLPLQSLSLHLHAFSLGPVPHLRPTSASPTLLTLLEYPPSYC